MIVFGLTEFDICAFLVAFLQPAAVTSAALYSAALYKSLLFGVAPLSTVQRGKPLY